MTLIWTHRGDGPENTLTAFENAWEKGITHFETDIQVTADGVIVLAHDSNTARITNESLLIENVTYSDLNKAPIDGALPWAKMAELIASFPQATISIDMKSDKSARALLEYLEKNSNYRNLVVGSFSAKRVNLLRSSFPNLATSLTVQEMLKLKFGVKLEPNSRVQKYAMVPQRISGVNVLTSSVIEKLNNLNIPIHVWTVNEQDDMKFLHDLGISGIVTDELDIALNLFRNR
jgi:glycerophosphoryl diester phosphodiesterase